MKQILQKSTRSYRSLLYLLLFIFSIGLATQQVSGQTLDQSSPTNGDMYNFTNVASGTTVIGQSFTAGVSGDLHSIELRTNATHSGVKTYDFTLYDGEGTGGTVLNSQFGIGSPAIGGTTFTITLPSSIALVNGNKYTFVLSNASGEIHLSTHNNFGYGAGYLYYVENSVLKFFPATACCASQDLYFKTYMNTTPAISTSGTLSAFTACSGTASAFQSFSVSGSSLTNDITVTAPTDFEVSTSSGSGYGPSLNLTQTGGTVASTTIYVRLTSGATGTPSGNVTCASAGATTQNVLAPLSSVNALPSAPTFGSNYNANYDGLFQLPTVTVGGGESIVWYNAASNGSVTTGLKNVGGPTTFYAAAKIDATGCESSTRTSGDVTITAQALTITANAESKTYGDVITGGAGKTAFGSSGLQNGETIGTVTLAYSDGDEATDAVGAYTITPSAATGGTFNASNYSITYNTGTLTVGTRGLTITANAESKTYGDVITGGAGKTAFGSSGLQNGETIGTVTLTYSDGDEATDAVGAYTITPSAAIGGTFTASNYSITYNTGTLTVGTRGLTITANAESKTYGDAITGGAGKTAFGSSGLQNGETIGTVTLTYSDGDEATDAVGAYTITPSAATGGTFTLSNYNVTYNTGTLTVGAKALTITANNQSKCHGSTFTFVGTEFTSLGLVNADAISSVTLTSSGAAGGATVGGSPYTIVPSAAVGTGLSNYSITYTNGNFTVWANPVASFSVNDIDQCLTPNSFDLLSTSTNGSGTINAYVWTAAGASIAPVGANPVAYTYAAAGSPTVTLQVTDNNGCTNTSSATTLTVWSNPTASFTINDFDQCLAGNSFIVNSTSTHGSGVSFSTYAWSATGASPSLTAVAGPPAFSYATRGLKTVNLTVTDNNGCANSTTLSDNITVWGNPIASFTINDNTQCLIGNSFTLTNTSTNSLDGAINDWAWTAAGGTPSSFAVVGPNVVTYATIGDKTVNLTVTDVNGCTNSTAFTNNIAVYGHPTAAFVTTESSVTVNDFNICTGSVVNFTGASSTAGAYPGSNLSSGLSAFQYQVTNLILPGPPAPANAGPGSNASVYAPVVNGTNGPVNDDFLYSLIVTNNWGCTDTTSGVNSRHIYVYPFPVTSITTPVVGTQGQYGVPANNGNGGQLLCHSKVVFGNTSTTPNGSIASYIWNYGDGSPSDVVTTADNVKHEFPVNYNINWFDAAFPNTRYTISLTAVTSQGCSTSTTTTRDIKNGPDAVIGLDNPTTQSLVGNSYLFRNLSQNRHPSFIDSSLWNWGDGTGTSNTTFIPKVYASAGNYRVHLITYTGTGCTDTAHIDLTVNAATASNFTVTPNTCGSKVVGFTSTSTGATTYSWNFGDGNTSTLANPSHTYAADGSYIVTLTINGGIASAPQTVHVVSNPVVGPIVNAGPSACGNTYTFSNVSTGVNLSYAWTFGGAASTGSTSTTASANRSYSVAGAATVDLVVSADGRCPVSATQISFTSVVGGGSPAAGVTIAAASVPAASSRSVNNTSTNASLYYVSVDGAAFVAKTVFPYDITGLTDGLHTVRLVASDLLGTCKDTATASFTVTLTPCIAVAGINTTPATTQTLATNKFDFFNTTVVNGFGWISANSWDFGDGTTSTNTHIYGKTYAAAGTYTVTLVATMSPGGCTSIATQVVTVTAATAANFTVTPNTCGSKVVGFTSTSTGATTYSWNFGDGSPAVTTANPNHTYASDGSYTVTLTINGSVVSTPQTVHVVSNPVVGPIVNAGPSACGNTYTFSNVSTGVNLSYAWTFGGAASTGSTSTTASANRSYSVAGAATVDLVVSADGRCPVSATQISFTSVVGGGSPVAGVTIAAASVPAATSKSVNNTSTNATLYAVSIDGGAFTAQTVFPYDITGLSNGAHTVRLVAAAAGWTCKDTATASFTVTTTTCVAVAGFNVSPSSSQPLGTNKFDFFNTTQHNGFGWITDYDWDFGDGTQDLTNTFVYGKTYASVGTYTVTLTAVSSTGCTSTYSSTVTVTPSASASFTYTPNTCGSLAIAFNSSGSVSASSYLWNFGDGNTSTSANPTHTYAAAGSYTVTLTINGTTTSAPQTVVVAATPTAATITPTVSSCGNVYTYTGSATGSGITYTWAFSNLTGTGATTGAAVTRTYSAAGTDNVTLTATSGACSATATLSGHAVLQVGAIIDANLSITAANGCNGTRTVNHTSTGATSYEVSVDGGAYVVKTVFPYDITGLAAGAHTVALKAINGLCSDIETVSFNVGSVTAAFTATPGSCNSTVAFTNTTTTTFGTPTYAWTFPTGTPSTSTATSPSTDYGSSGTKSATLVATLDNGCSTSVTNSAIAVVGSGGPVASFTSSMIVGGGCNTGVQFTSTSTGATTYTWNYGDGTVSVNSSNPTIFHAYSSVGTYNVTLTASNGTCSSTSATTPVVVTATGNAVPEAAFNIINRPAVQCITGNRYDFFNTTQLNGWGWVPTYSWDFGDGTTSTATMAYGKTYATAGTYTVTLTAVSNLGCSATATMDVTVNGLPCAGMIAGTTPGNYDGPNTYGAATTIASGVEESADISNKVGLYPNPTRGNFRLTIENVKGNKATITIVDMLGREVYQHNYNILGTEYIDINDLNLAEGKYNLVLRSNSDQVARKSFAVIK